VVLYMAMRIRSEQYTMEELAGDIGTGTSYTNVVEMHDKTNLDRVPYANVVEMHDKTNLNLV